MVFRSLCDTCHFLSFVLFTHSLSGHLIFIIPRCVMSIPKSLLDFFSPRLFDKVVLQPALISCLHSFSSNMIRVIEFLFQYMWSCLQSQVTYAIIRMKLVEDGALQLILQDGKLVLLTHSSARCVEFTVFLHTPLSSPRSLRVCVQILPFINLRRFSSRSTTISELPLA